MTVDFAAVTQRQQKMWGMGDYSQVARGVNWLAESLVHTLDVHAGERVLDVAAGSGNATLPAARRFADVLATDFVPELLRHVERRADAEGLDVRTQVADAQDLPFPDGEFDVVMSAIGAMFAPDQPAVARELTRVCRSGGRVGMANWAPGSMAADLFRTVAAHVPPPEGVASPINWGREDFVQEVLGPYCSDIRVDQQECPLRFLSVEAYVDHFSQWFGPVANALTQLDPSGQEEFLKELGDVVAQHNRATDGTLAIEMGYIEVVAIRS
jgi:SAM-dependent methyltransferase